jgi:hypothetical protein
MPKLAAETLRRVGAEAPNFRSGLLAAVALVASIAIAPAHRAGAVEPGCPGSGAPDPDVLFCDDFDGAPPLAGPGKPYFEYNTGANGQFVPVGGVGRNGSKAMRAHWNAGQIQAGSLHILFGRVPNDGYRVTDIRPNDDFREIYWRQFVKMHADWTGGHPAKLSRAFSFGAVGHWGQAMIGHLWDGPALALDPASGIKEVAGVDTLVTTSYNDGANFTWLGSRRGTSTIFTEQNAGKWFCIEAHIALNTPGQADGVFEYWIDDGIEARRESLNWVRSWQDYAINAVYFENYTNGGSPVERERYFDNLVISTERIGCTPEGPAATVPALSGTGRAVLAVFLAGGAIGCLRRRRARSELRLSRPATPRSARPWS